MIVIRTTTPGVFALAACCLLAHSSALAQSPDGSGTASGFLTITKSEDFKLTLFENSSDEVGFTAPELKLEGITPFGWKNYFVFLNSTMDIEGEAELLSGFIQFDANDPVNTPLLNLRFDWEVSKFDPPILISNTIPVDERLFEFNCTGDCGLTVGSLFGEGTIPRLFYQLPQEWFLFNSEVDADVVPEPFDLGTLPLTSGDISLSDDLLNDFLPITFKVDSRTDYLTAGTWFQPIFEIRGNALIQVELQKEDFLRSRIEDTANAFEALAIEGQLLGLGSQMASLGQKDILGIFGLGSHVSQDDLYSGADLAAAVANLIQVGQGTLDPSIATLAILAPFFEKQAKVLREIIADPPDPNYQEITTIVDVRFPTEALNFSPEVSSALADLFEAQSALAQNLEAQLTSIERYQGAWIAGEGEAADMQADALTEFAEAYPETASRLNSSLRSLRIAIEDTSAGSISFDRATLESSIALLRSNGLGADVIELLASLGIERPSEDWSALILPKLDDLLDAPVPADGTLPGALDSAVAATNDLASLADETPDAELSVSIDIRPFSTSNRVIPNLGLIPVGIFGSSTFDALQVDTSSVKFGPSGGPPIRWKIDTKDINRDGFVDLLLFFRARKTGIECGDTEATMTGRTFPGEEFIATDAIKTVWCR